MGRPRKEIDTEAFKKLCGLQCTLAEIAGFFDCSEDTIERWCKRELGMSFADAFKKHSAAGLLSLRRNQFKLSEKHPNMAIWLGKVYLHQRGDEKPENGEDDPLIAMLKKWEEAANADADRKSETV